MASTMYDPSCNALQCILSYFIRFKVSFYNMIFSQIHKPCISIESTQFSKVIYLEKFVGDKLTFITFSRRRSITNRLSNFQEAVIVELQGSLDKTDDILGKRLNLRCFLALEQLKKTLKFLAARKLFPRARLITNMNINSRYL